MALSHTFHNPPRFLTGFFCILLSIMILSGCVDDKSCNKIHSLLVSETKSEDNYNQLVKLIMRNKNCQDSLLIKNGIMHDGDLDEDKLKAYFFSTNTKTDTTKNNIKVNIFLENSASMWGYFKGSTDCESVLSKIVVHSGGSFGKEDLTFSFITDQIFEQKPINHDVISFVSRIEPKQLEVGDYENTQISDIIKTVIDKTEKENFSILLTDCIYSKREEGSTTESVNFEWTLIEDAFLTKLKKSQISVLINKYSSNYKGYYVSMDNIKDKKVAQKVGDGKNKFNRPYYVIAIGETKVMESALKEIDFKSYPGYQYSYLITQPKSTELLDYRILNSNKKGSFRPDKKDKKHTIVDAQKETRGIDKGKFQFTIAANLSELHLEDDYISDPDKYKVNSDYDISVETITEDMRDKDNGLNGYTHLISLQTQSNLREESIKISLKRGTPGWIIDTHTDDDLSLDSLHQTKTRGFKYLVNGIESAFDKAQNRAKNKTDLKYYFTLQVNVKL